MVRMARLALRHGRLPRHQAAMLAQRQAMLEPYRGRDWSETPLTELLAELDVLVDLRNSSQWLFFISAMGMAVRNALLRRWAERRVSNVPFNDLIRGLVSLRSLEPLQEIGRLAALAGQLPLDLRTDLATNTPDELRTRLSASPEGRALLDGVSNFLVRFGFLSNNGSDFTATSWAENPAMVWQAIARAAANPEVASPRAAAQAREDARRQVRARLGPLARRVFDGLLASAVASIELREAVSLMMSEYSFEMRRIFLAVADRLIAKGYLVEREDLFYLDSDEMRAVAREGLPINEARERIARRRAEIEADAKIAVPSVISGDPDSIRKTLPPEPEATEYLSGIAGSFGTVHGWARIVNDPVEAPAALNRQDILIVPYSDVGWTPLFSSIGGIVAETGGQLSHAAVVAREYGLPAVVGVKHATRLIREGQPLFVDGGRGRVYLAPGSISSGGD
jgi:rifampicin phosphotransferase